MQHKCMFDISQMHIVAKASFPSFPPFQSTYMCKYCFLPLLICQP